MVYRTLLSVIFLFPSLVGISYQKEPTDNVKVPTKTNVVTLSNITKTPTETDNLKPPTETDKAKIELFFQMLDPRTPNIEYWDRVARCETSSNWKDKGNQAGGLGIYTVGKFPDQNMGTWERWGGEQFAKSPDKATKIEQIVVANRIAIFGWSTLVHRTNWKRQGVTPTFTWVKKGIGYNGWGCIKNTVKPPTKTDKVKSSLKTTK